jgi:hypothetical protein
MGSARLVAGSGSLKTDRLFGFGMLLIRTKSNQLRYYSGKAFPLVATSCAPHPFLRGHPATPPRLSSLRDSPPVCHVRWGSCFAPTELATPVACCAPSPRSSRRPLGCGTTPNAPLQPCTRASLRDFRCASGCVLLSPWLFRWLGLGYDHFLRFLQPPKSGFNPRPCEGATYAVCDRCGERRVSIRAPVKGRPSV